MTDLPDAALDLARVFAAGGRLIVSAPGRHDHAQHVAVEFVHPAVVGARSLPALAVDSGDLALIVTPDDAILVIGSPDTPAVPLPPAALVLTTDPFIAEPALVRWYHVLWELVQIGLEHPGLTGGGGVAGGDATSFLYPFLDASESSETELLDAMRLSAAAKEDESATISAKAVAHNETALAATARAIDDCHRAGGMVHTIGNGGSASDASRLARQLRTRGVRATSLVADPAVLTALGNDLGIDRIFARQVEAAVHPGDVLCVFSTSGTSSNLLAALDVDVASRVTVVASAGYGGGQLAAHPATDLTLTIDSSSVHRIQEAQGVLIDEVCSLVGADLEVTQ